jgi:outer membrane protein, heavy metal efflux system
MKSFLFLSSVILLSSLRAAEEIPLTLPQALAFAAERNPGLVAQSFQERAAAGMVEQAGLRPNPKLDVTAENFAGTGRLQGVRGFETTVQASQTFERGGKREKRVAVASRERDTAAREFAVRRTEVLASAASAYVAALAAQERLALAAEPLRLARETVSVIDTRIKNGAASQIELARARAALAATQAEFARAEAELAAARTALATTWGGDASEAKMLAGALRTPEALPDQNKFRARLAVHPRLELQAAVVAGRRAALSLEQAHATADVTASGGVRFLRDGTDAAFVAGVSLPLPLRNKNQGSIRSAREMLAGAESTASAIASDLRAAFTAAWQDLAAAHTAAQSLRRDALPATEEAYAAVRRAYAAGPIPLTDVLDAQRALVAIRREILAAETGYATALVRVEALIDPAFSATLALFSSP